MGGIFFFWSSFISFVLLVFEGTLWMQRSPMSGGLGAPLLGAGCERPGTFPCALEGPRPPRGAGWGDRCRLRLEGWEDPGRAAESGWGQEWGWGSWSTRRDPCD